MERCVAFRLMMPRNMVLESYTEEGGYWVIGPVQNCAEPLRRWSKTVHDLVCLLRRGRFGHKYYFGWQLGRRKCCCGLTSVEFRGLWWGEWAVS